MTTQKMPAPEGWADAYRETLEHLWQAMNDDDHAFTSAADLRALTAYAAEIREGIAAGLLAASAVVRVPKLDLPMRDEQPRTGHGNPRTDPDTGRTGPQA